MDRTGKIAEQLGSLLPDRPSAPGLGTQASAVEQEAARLRLRQDAKEIAQIRYREKRKLQALEKKQAEQALLQAKAEELGLDWPSEARTEAQMEKLAEQKKKAEAIEAVEEQVQGALHPAELAESVSEKRAYSSTVTKALQAQGTTRPEVVKLLSQLGISLNVQLSKQDTANLLACLLTCNESQLAALCSNKKVPLAIKTVVKRLQEDAKTGCTDTVEMLWDRLFGKGAMQLSLPEQAQLETGILPDVPVSREAYIVIRDTLLK